jgi:iron complex transport system substrate-binding protein
MNSVRSALACVLLGLVAVTGVACAPADESAGTAAPTGTAQDGFPRTVDTGMGGTVTLDHRPTRLAVLVSGTPDQALSLGVTPIAMATTGGSAAVPAYLKDRLAGVETIGTSGEVNLEKLAGLAPDLIVTSKVASADQFDKLSAIAPTVMTTAEVGAGWQANLRQLGHLLGEDARADQVLAAYMTRAGDVGAAIEGKRGSMPTVSLVRFGPGEVRLMLDSSFPGTILRDVGLKRPAAQAEPGISATISLEQLALADADHIFNGATTKLDDGGRAMRANKVWQQLPAVTAGHVTTVADDVWYVGLGPLAAGIVLTQLAAAFAVPAPA